MEACDEVTWETGGKVEEQRPRIESRGPPPRAISMEYKGVAKKVERKTEYIFFFVME